MKTNTLHFSLKANQMTVLKALLDARDRKFDRTRVPMHRVRWVPTGPTSGQWIREN